MEEWNSEEKRLSPCVFSFVGVLFSTAQESRMICMELGLRCFEEPQFPVLGSSPGYPSTPVECPRYPSTPVERPGYPNTPVERSGYPSIPAEYPGYPSTPDVAPRVPSIREYQYQYRWSTQGTQVLRLGVQGSQYSGCAYRVPQYSD
ncbi:hypothetical protein JTE90_016168 [Oedothorax gibbosus]|uniref:Uncharacterized protein n=1 Tax=Oedothorax gibbosus TaxID=931172 RepID=A0AAV6UU73_9ARAC|nr:hypothetical protein JTE90_016168 [Oedothorax gibbosus]